MTDARETALTIRSLVEDDAQVISESFARIGWSKPAEQYVRYVTEQHEGVRECWIALAGGSFAGYVTIRWSPDYLGLVGSGVPEIQDLNVLPEFRKRGIASRLLDFAETEAGRRSHVVGIGVGLHPGYNAAQRLYVKRGYVPDGLGVTYKDRFVTEGEHVPFDDDLVLHFTKELSSKVPDATEEVVSSSDRSELLAANRANWNARAIVHATSEFYDVQRYIDGRTTISDVVDWDRRALGDVTGLDILHLQCHIGTDTISWARLGAQVTGLDFSEQSLRIARDLAARTGTHARFVCADVCTADQVLLQEFDLVYASVGVLCWIPSFDDWARAASACVRPGGRLYLRDGHAIHDTIDYRRTDGQVVCVGDYFGGNAPYKSESDYTYTGDDVRLDAPLNFEWTHPISKIITALIANGLRIDRFDEMDWLDSQALPWMVKDPDGHWRLPEGGPRLPLSFSIVATKQ